MKILLATDAWPPQVNGVVRTLTALIGELERLGHSAIVLHPALFANLPCPGYPEIRLVPFAARRIGRLIDEAAPDAVHIATEGSIGFAVRRWCLARRAAFTTAFHTRFPEYLSQRFHAPERLTYAILRRFHAPARSIMVATPSVRRDLAARGFDRLCAWTRGVDHELFNPARRVEELGFPRPIFLTVARIACEKNLEAFLALDLPGTKLVVGDGPQLASLKRRFAGAHFLGHRENGDLARLYASADVFVFPSRTDTFGLVLLEALASGVPVAAFPVAGPLDVIGSSGAGALDEDLRRAALRALSISRTDARAHALTYSWANCAEQFVKQLCPLR